MNSLRVKLRLFATTIIFIGLFLGWYFQWRNITPRVRSDFEWFQTLGFPDVKSCPYVRVATGYWSQTGDDSSRSNHYENSFLLTTNGNVFKVLTAELSVETFTNTPDSTPEYSRVGFEVLNIRKEVQAEIQRLEQPPSQKGFFRLFGSKANEQTETFALAWACWRKGLDRDARRLYDQAETMLRPYPKTGGLTLRKKLLVAWEKLQEKWRELTSKNNNQQPKLTLRQMVEKDLATATIWRATLAFEDKSITRPLLLEQFKAFLRRYPGSKHEEIAKDTVKTLEQMTAEDQAHVPVEPFKLLSLPVENRVRELIFELRDQNGQQISQPGSCNIFMDRQRSTNTPAHQLVRIGYAAVPQLIEALDTKTLTRSVTYWRDFTFSHHVLTVGDCAQAILGQITGRSFYVHDGSTNKPPGGPSPRRKAAEAWWADFQRKGEKQMLTETVSAGSMDAPQAANLLCQKYPEAALEPLIRGIQACNTTWTRTQLLQSLASLGGNDSIQFLRQEMTNSPYLEARVEAAYGLRKQAKAETISAMIAEWENLPEPNGSNDDNDGVQRLMQFLVTSDSVDAVSVLSNGLASQPVHLRYEVVEQIGEDFQYDIGHEMKPFSAATLEAQEAFLVSELHDTEERTGLGGSRNGINYSDPRICDMAAWYLSERWPGRYRFDIRKSLRSREVQRITCLNTWRHAHNLSLEPLPNTNLPKVAREHSTWVMQIEFATNGVAPQPALTARLEQLKGKPLRSDDVVKLLCDFVKNLEPNAAGLQIIASKDDDLTGVQMMVRLTPNPPPSSSDNWQMNEGVTCGNENLLSSAGGGTGNAYQETETWNDLAEAIQKAASAPPETPFKLNISLRREK